MNPYRFENRGRSRRAALALLLIWGLLLFGLWAIELSPLIAGAVAFFTLPALWEFVTDPRSTLTLTNDEIGWQCAHSGDTVPLGLIAKVRLDTRLDLSVRLTLILTDARKIRLPHACTPPHRHFEEELKARGVATERHHFSLFG